MANKSTGARATKSGDIDSLSREEQILHLAAHGYTDKQSAQQLGISAATVATYWQRLRNRYHASSRAQVIARAYMEGQSKYLAVVNACPDALLIIEEGRIVFANPAAAALLSADNAQEIVGKPVDAITDPRDMPDVLARRKQIYHQKVRSLEFRRTVVRLDGSRIQCDAFVTALDVPARRALVLLRKCA
jgi:DNA-binding CsgD family transcriptional regulator